MPVNILTFSGITVLLCGVRLQINGTIIKNPAQIIASIPNNFFLVLGCLAFVLSNLAPKHLTFKHAALILRWRLDHSPVVIVYFLPGLADPRLRSCCCQARRRDDL